MPGTISRGGGGGGGEDAVRFRPNTKSGGPLFGIGPSLFKYVITGYNFGRGGGGGGEAPGAPSLSGYVTTG